MAFDPDHFLASPPPTATAPAATSPVTAAPSGFDPDAFLKSTAPEAPPPSRAEAVGRGTLQGASLGFADEIAASVDSLVSKIPGVRSVAQSLQSPDLPALTDPNVTYQQRRDAYRAKNQAAEDAHGKLYTAGEIGGGLATTVIPGLGALKGAGAVKTGLQAAAIGGIAGAGSSNADTAAGVAKDAAKSAVIGGVGGALLHATGSKVASLLAKKGPELQAIADRQAVKQLARDAPQSLTNPMTQDANLSAAINEPIEVAPKKSLTLAQIAGKPAAEVRPILNAGQEKIDQKMGTLFGKSDAATNGGADLADVAKGYDAKIGEYAKTPGTKKFANALEGARQDALEKWGPAEQEIEAKKGEIGGEIGKVYDKSDLASGGVPVADLVNHYDSQIARLGADPLNDQSARAVDNARQSVLKAYGPSEAAVTARQAQIGNGLDKIYDKADAASGGVRVGDLVKHYDDQIAALRKTPGNEAFIKAMQEAKNSVSQAWATGEKFDPAAIVKGGTLEGQKTGDAIAMLEKMKAANPQHATDLGAEIDRIKSDATTSGFDPNVKVPAKDVRAFATTLQDRAAPDVSNPSVGKQVRMALGSTTRDFVNSHVADTLGAGDAKTLAGLNRRISTLYKAGDVMSGAEKDPAIRDAILNEFQPKVSSKAVHALASKLEESGKGVDATATRDFLNSHAGSVLGPADRKSLEGLNGRMSNLYRWPDVVAGKEADPAVRDAVLKEFGTKVPTKALNDFANTLEERGTQRIDKLSPGEASQAKEALGATTRDLANAHAAKSLQPDDLAEFNRLGAHRASLKNIDAILSRREGKENAAKMGLRDILTHGTGAGIAAMELAHAVPKALAGDIGGAAAHVGSAVAAGALPFAAKNATAIGRAGLRGTARAVTGGSALLARIAAAADAGNPWAIRQIQALRSTQAGIARLAALRSPGGAGSTAMEAAQPAPEGLPSVASAP